MGGRRSGYALPAIIVSVLLAGVAAGVSRLALARYMRYDLGSSAFIVSSLTTWFMGARAFSALASGVVADLSPWARRLLMSAPMLGIALVVYASSLIRDPFLLLLANALWGFLSGMVWPLTQTVTSLLAHGRSGAVMSIYFAVASLGMTAGTYLYGLLPTGNPGALRVGSLFFAAAGLGLAAASLSIDQEKLQPPRSRGGLRAALSNLTPASLWILLAAFTIGYSSGLLKEFLYIYFGEVYGLSRGELASALAAAGLVSFAAGLAVGPLADRVGAVPVLAALLAAGVTGNLLLASPSLAPAFAGLVLVTTMVRSSLPLTRNAAFLGTAYAATMVGASNTLNNIGQMIGPPMAGAIYDRMHGRTLGPIPGAAAPFLAAAIILLLPLLLLPRVTRREKGGGG